jgi:hypothetical protein
MSSALLVVGYGFKGRSLHAQTYKHNLTLLQDPLAQYSDQLLRRRCQPTPRDQRERLVFREQPT